MEKKGQAAKPKKTFKDPVRQKLEDDKSLLAQYKKDWNAKIKIFNKELKKLKNELHGNVEGEMRIHLDEKLPEDLPSNILQLAEYFNQQANQAQKIINFQSQVSDRSKEFFSALEEKRKQIRTREENKAKAAAQEDYNLISEAISPLHLQWLKAKSFFGDRDQKIKMLSLQRVYDLDKMFSELENQVLGVSAPEGFEKLKLPVNDIIRQTDSVKKLIIQDYEELRNKPAVISKPEEASNKEGNQMEESSNEKENINNAHKIIDDLKNYMSVKSFCLKGKENDQKFIDKINIFDNFIKQMNDLGYKIIDGKVSHSRVASLYSLYEDFIKTKFGLIAVTDNIDLWVGEISDLQYFKNCLDKFRQKDVLSIDDNAVYDPLGTKVKKWIKYPFVSQEIKILYDLIRKNRLSLELIMNEIISGFNIEKIVKEFEKEGGRLKDLGKGGEGAKEKGIEARNMLLLTRINNLSIKRIITEKDFEQAERTVGRGILRRLFKGNDKDKGLTE